MSAPQSTLSVLSEINESMNTLDSQVKKQDKAIIAVFSYTTSSINNINEKVGNNAESIETIINNVKTLSKKVEKVLMDYTSENDIEILEKEFNKELAKRDSIIEEQKAKIEKLEENLEKVNKVVNEYQLVENKNYIYIKKINRIEKAWYWLVNKVYPIFHIRQIRNEKLEFIRKEKEKEEQLLLEEQRKKELEIQKKKEKREQINKLLKGNK